MKNIFISYGHDKYADLADKLYDRLSALTDENGNVLFHVEKDNRGTINDGRQWDNDLENAVSSSSVIIFLMSGHSVRKDSVCLDEIAFARNKGGISIIPLRVENVAAPFLICRLQWIEWLENPDNFDKVFERILKVIERYDLDKNDGSQGVLFNRLFKADFFCDTGSIIGREDVIAEIESFIAGDIAAPLVLKGIAGSGKSAVVSLLSKNTGLVRSVHRCRFDFQETRTARNALCNLAYFLSRRNERYAMRIASAELDKVEIWSLRELFEELFVKPLNDEEEKYALIIDGVDEMELSEARELINVLGDGAKHIRNVRFIISVRNERNFAACCKGLPSVELTEGKNRAAAEKMLKAELERRGILSEKLLKRLLDASEGNFLYLAKLFEECDINGTEIGEDSVFPEGLIAQYAASLERYFPDEELYRSEYAPVLSVLCAVKRPVAAEELAALTGYSKIGLNSVLLKLRYLIKTEAQRISVYHRSMKDFLVSDDSGEYMIDPGEGDKLIVENTIKSDIRELKRSEYLSGYLFCHIFRQRASGFADKLYEADEEWAEGCAAASLLAFEEEEFVFFADTAAGMKNGRIITGEFFYKLYDDRKIQAAGLIAESIAVMPTFSFDALRYKGDCCFVSDRISEAEKYYNKAFELAESRADSDPSYDNLSDLSISYNRLADIAVKEDDIKEAKRLYSLALEIDEQLAAAFPSYQSSRDLSISYNRLADIAVKEDDIKEAKRLYSLALEIREQLAADFPSYESRRGLAVSCYYLAKIEIICGNKDKARALVNRGLVSAKENLEKFPCEDSRTVYDALPGLLEYC